MSTFNHDDLGESMLLLYQIFDKKTIDRSFFLILVGKLIISQYKLFGFQFLQDMSLLA